MARKRDLTHIISWRTCVPICAWAIAWLFGTLALAQDASEPEASPPEVSQPATNAPEQAAPKAEPQVSVPATPIARRPENAAEVLEFFDVDESLLRQLVDHRPLVAEEEEAIVRVLYALPNVPAQDVERWAEKSPDWNAVIAEPQQYRTNFYQLSGYVTSIERVDLIPEAVQRFGYSHYYRAVVELGEDKWKAVVCARKIPEMWQVDAPIQEAVSFYGMFLKLGNQPVFAAKRLAWHPNHVDDEAGISKNHVFLGDLGMDVGLWDDVRDRQPFLTTERECFYQLLAALGRTNQEHMRLRSAEEFDFADLLRHPQKYHGQILTIDGVARRATRVEISDPDIVARFGADHYFEVDVIVHLKTMLVYKRENGETLEYRKFPVVCNVRELPSGMPTGDDIRQRVRIPAVFFKIWAYEAAKMNQFNEDQRQHSPMLLGVAPDMFRTEAAYNPYLGVLVGCAFIVAMLGVWIGVWRFEGDTLKREHAVEPGKSLNDLGLVDKGEPDFRHLD